MFIHDTRMTEHVKPIEGINYHYVPPQDDDTIDKTFHAIDFFAEIRRAHGFTVEWSVFKYLDFNLLDSVNLDLTLTYEGHTIKIDLDNPTSLDVWAAVNHLVVKMAGDLHHVFYEGLDVVDEKGYKVFTPIMGS